MGPLARVTNATFLFAGWFRGPEQLGKAMQDPLALLHEVVVVLFHAHEVLVELERLVPDRPELVFVGQVVHFLIILQQQAK